MTKLTVDGRDYELEQLSEAARQHLKEVNVVDEEIRRLQMRLAIYQTARNGYLAALQAALKAS